MKILSIKTERGTITTPIRDNPDAVNFLRMLTREGIKCTRWEVKECSQSG